MGRSTASMTPKKRREKRARDLSYRRKNREQLKKKQLKYYRQDKVRRKNYQLQRAYGITLAQFHAMLSTQKGACAICGTVTPGGNGNFHVDHDHQTKRVRGLLCSSCNRGLGFFKDRLDLLVRAAQYLQTASTRTFDVPLVVK